ncbi:hypothetical protein OG455_29140 [Kitasatospora sp. NBC_01287]|uniref:PspA-associated protein PspAA n=1 Tax=Kitasatospora sp. NBC_01287 TaxID=2903573 RepID=UPI00225151FD|nr:hypothetical protein [Kitasatospora sp. NBC_01287]MCX4749528.1 hypothetical protein [Kitasatospora sp. NBC_01287]
MIMRIMGEGQFQVGDEHLGRLNQLDDELLIALDAGDDAVFRAKLGNLLTAVRELGTPLPVDSLEPSDLILPDDGATIEQVRELLLGEGEGIIPGFAE